MEQKRLETLRGKAQRDGLTTTQAGEVFALVDELLQWKDNHDHVMETWTKTTAALESREAQAVQNWTERNQARAWAVLWKRQAKKYRDLFVHTDDHAHLLVKMFDTADEQRDGLTARVAELEAERDEYRRVISRAYEILTDPNLNHQSRAVGAKLKLAWVGTLGDPLPFDATTDSDHAPDSKASRCRACNAPVEASADAAAALCDACVEKGARFTDDNERGGLDTSAKG